MIHKCDGCGAKIQSVDPQKKGYIKSEVYLKNPDNFYCERCYNLIHYNRNLVTEINEQEFQDNIKKIAQSGALVVNIVDIYDLEGTIVPIINDYFPNNDLIIVGNKFDLFLNSVKVTRVKNYLINFLKEKSITTKSTLIISSFNENDIIRLLNEIDRLQAGRDVYLFGMTNVGKSSIVNGIIKILKGKQGKVTVSNIIGTTLDFIKIPLPNKTFLIDTPGILNYHQATYYLDNEHMSLLTPRKFIKPKVFQLNPNQALFIGGFCVFKFYEGVKSSFVVNVPNGMVIHRTKLENYQSFYDEHKDDILLIPNENERNKLGNFKKYNFSFSDEKIDITISGLGFVTLIGSGRVEVECFEKIKVSSRKAII